MTSHPWFNMTSLGENVTWAGFIISPMLYDLENAGNAVGLSSLMTINLFVSESCKNQIF
jgi:hypothetical protein